MKKFNHCAWSRKEIKEIPVKKKEYYLPKRTGRKRILCTK
jgi:hypothetical protein